MKRTALVCLGFSVIVSFALGQGKADWVPDKVDPVGLAKRAESRLKTFRSKAGKGVVGNAVLDGKAAAPIDKLGYGFIHRRTLNEYFWSPSKFQISYEVYGQNPEKEYIWSDGAGHMMRLGPKVGTSGTVFSPKQHLFDVQKDADLVEKWPMHFTKYLLSPFVGGNATLSRYVAALVKGVGGYKVTTAHRGNPSERRILAERPKRGKLPASTVEIIFRDEEPYLPVIIHTTHGNIWDLVWRMGWYNNSPLPKNPGELKD